jgi:hypothetical protein
LIEKSVCERLLVLDVSLAQKFPEFRQTGLFDMAPHMARRRGSFYEELGAGDPVGAGADESAALRLIRTAPLAICKRARSDFPTAHTAHTMFVVPLAHIITNG